MRGAAFVALVALAVYLGSFRSIVTFDGVTNVVLSYRIAAAGDVDLSDFVAQGMWLESVRYGDRPVSIFPPGAAFFAVPFAAVGILVGIAPPLAASVSIVGKAAAAAATAGSVFFVYLVAARVAGRRIAVVVAALYAFATVTWPISAGTLWQHGVSQLFLAVALLWSLPTSRTTPWPARAGLPLGLAVLTRPTDLVFALASLALLSRRPREATAFLGWATGPAVLLAAYNLAAFGSLLAHSYVVPATGNFLVGLLGNLISPSRGLFVYSPFLILAAYELARRCLRSGRLATLLRSQSVAALVIVALYASYADWWGGFGYGNRFLSDLLPLLALGLALWLRRHRRSGRARVALAASAVPALAISGLGALAYDARTWSWEMTPGAGLGNLVWRIDSPQWWYTATHAGTWVDGLTLVSAAIAICGWTLLALAFARNRARGRTAKRATISHAAGWRSRSL